jgi:hypothetical protein
MGKLSHENLLSIIRKEFKKREEPGKKKTAHSLSDCLMSGLSIFSLKYPSLLKYDNEREAIAENLKNLYGIENPPSDTSLRERLDQVKPETLRNSFKKLFAAVQRSKYLEPYVYHQGSYLVSLDGTGYFSSNEIHCDNCCEKHHKDGSTTYYHQILQAAVVHPHKAQVIPFAPEPISKQDGNSKNDCERNAAKRLLKDLRREHPHLSLTIIADALYSNAPLLKTLEELNMRYIIGAKEADHTWLFDYCKHANAGVHSTTDDEGYQHEYRYVNQAPLNASHEERKVNFLECREISPKNTVKTFTWITDFHLTNNTVERIMRGGRARWKIENETFNTLKNQGYQFEHNFGHGYQHLSHVFANLMLLAFLIDQIQAMACPMFQAAVVKMKRLSYLWPRVLGIIFNFVVGSWQDLYGFIARADKAVIPLNSS